jgi:hypothetical protein
MKMNARSNFKKSTAFSIIFSIKTCVDKAMMLYTKFNFELPNALSYLERELSSQCVTTINMI